jgi:photosystem II stability/assembly factor-like uncharacterized protein
MKKILYLGVLLLIIVFYSGCSLIPEPSGLGIGGNEKAKVVTPNKRSTSALEYEIVVGSIWKSSNGGHTFKSKSMIDKEVLASYEDQKNGENSSENTKSKAKPDDGKNKGGSGTIDNKSITKIQDEEGNIFTTADVLSIAFHPARQKTIYVSTANDGLFKTLDAGELWKPIPFPPKNVYSFVIDTRDPDNTMFASGVTVNWGKIFRTKNGGIDWEEVYTEPGDSVPITSLIQNNKSQNVFFAGTKSGTVVKSIDSGDTWKNVGKCEDYWDERNKVAIKGEVILGNVTDFAFDAKKISNMYLITFSDKIYYSNKSGEEWIDWELRKQRELEEMYYSEKPDYDKIEEFRKRMEIEKTPQGIVSVAADPYISGLVYVGTNQGLYKSDSFGKWWKKINVIESVNLYPIRSIAINPRKSSEIVFVSGKAFYKTTDTGKTWEVVGLDVDRDVSFATYDLFDSNYIFVGLRKFDNN